jgi:transposase
MSLGRCAQDEMFVALFPKEGQPALAPWRLALVTIMQFAEGLSDRQAAHAVRAHLDWKYALGLELEDRGFDFSVRIASFAPGLSKATRSRFCLKPCSLASSNSVLSKQEADNATFATHVLASVRAINRVVCVGETMRATLNTRAVVAPEWLSSFAPDEWYERVSRIEWKSIDFLKSKPNAWLLPKR